MKWSCNLKYPLLNLLNVTTKNKFLPPILPGQRRIKHSSNRLSLVDNNRLTKVRFFFFNRQRFFVFSWMEDRSHFNAIKQRKGHLDIRRKRLDPSLLSHFKSTQLIARINRWHLYFLQISLTPGINLIPIGIALQEILHQRTVFFQIKVHFIFFPFNWGCIFFSHTFRIYSFTIHLISSISQNNEPVCIINKLIKRPVVRKNLQELLVLSSPVYPEN